MQWLLAFLLALLAPHALAQSAPQAHQKVETPMATDERLEAPGWWPTKHSASREDYVGTKECARCHSKKTASQLATPMAHASTPAATSGILREHEQISLQRDPYSYTITRTGTGSTYSVSDGTSSISAPLRWAFGVGNKGQTYLYQRNGFFYESRMSFYKTLQGLDLTTGQGSEAPDNLEDALGRMIDPDTLRRCFGCHTTAAVTNTGFDSSRLMPGVNCEACHGPGAKHAALMDEEKTEQGRQAIFNPSRLNPVALVDFCGACHRTWNDVYELGATGVANARFQPYRLENSRCWGDGDARLACIACHDPHQQLVHEAGAYDEKCLACHIAAPVKKVTRDHPGKACPAGKRDCVTCHMPRIVVPNMHAPFTDHRIRIVREGEHYPD
jgi:Cytochrome c554 and c-prime